MWAILWNVFERLYFSRTGEISVGKRLEYALSHTIKTTLCAVRTCSLIALISLPNVVQCVYSVSLRYAWNSWANFSIAYLNCFVSSCLKQNETVCNKKMLFLHFKRARLFVPVLNDLCDERDCHHFDIAHIAYSCENFSLALFPIFCEIAVDAVRFTYTLCMCVYIIYLEFDTSQQFQSSGPFLYSLIWMKTNFFRFLLSAVGADYLLFLLSISWRLFNFRVTFPNGISIHTHTYFVLAKKPIFRLKNDTTNAQFSDYTHFYERPSYDTIIHQSNATLSLSQNPKKTRGSGRGQGGNELYFIDSPNIHFVVPFELLFIFHSSFMRHGFPRRARMTIEILIEMKASWVY